MAKAARLVICLDNSGYEVSLERRKIYFVAPGVKAEKHGQLRHAPQGEAKFWMEPKIELANNYDLNSRDLK